LAGARELLQHQTGTGWYASQTGLAVIFAVGLAFHLTLCLGVASSLSALICALLWSAICGRFPYIVTYAEQLLVVLLSFLVFLPAGRTMAWSSRGKTQKRSVPLLYVRAVQLQFGVMYARTGFA